MPKALTVIGTRPQFIKYAALSAGLKRIFSEVLVDTGQHYDRNLSTGLFEQLGIEPPRHSLAVAGEGGLPQIADMLAKLHVLLERERPDVLVCLGDTNSTLAAALAAVKHGVPVAHVEAGERNFTADGTRVAPWTIPEEANRVMVDGVSSLLLCASRRAAENLGAEQVRGQVAHTGDISYDLYLRTVPQALEKAALLGELGLRAGEYCFCTVHRALNTEDGGRLAGIVDALTRLPLPVVLPLHPRTRAALHAYGLYERLEASGRVRLLEPVGYLESVLLSHQAGLVVTDSGGVVREAYFAGVPSVCLDDTTEWIDLVHTGWSALAGADTQAILNAAGAGRPAERPPLFGDGHAVERTLEELSRCWA